MKKPDCPFVQTCAFGPAGLADDDVVVSISVNFFAYFGGSFL